MDEKDFKQAMKWYRRAPVTRVAPETGSLSSAPKKDISQREKARVWFPRERPACSADLDADKTQDKNENIHHALMVYREKTLAKHRKSEKMNQPEAFNAPEIPLAETMSEDNPPHDVDYRVIRDEEELLLGMSEEVGLTTDEKQSDSNFLAVLSSMEEGIAGMLSEKTSNKAFSDRKRKKQIESQIEAELAKLSKEELEEIKGFDLSLLREDDDDLEQEPLSEMIAGLSEEEKAEIAGFDLSLLKDDPNPTDVGTSEKTEEVSELQKEADEPAENQESHAQEISGFSDEIEQQDVLEDTALEPGAMALSDAVAIDDKVLPEIQDIQLELTTEEPEDVSQAIAVLPDLADEAETAAAELSDTVLEITSPVAEEVPISEVTEEAALVDIGDAVSEEEIDSLSDEALSVSDADDLPEEIESADVSDSGEITSIEENEQDVIELSDEKTEDAGDLSQSAVLEEAENQTAEKITVLSEPKKIIPDPENALADGILLAEGDNLPDFDVPVVSSPNKVPQETPAVIPEEDIFREKMESHQRNKLAFAQYKVAVVYARKNTAEALREMIKWYTLAADNGHAVSQFNLGNIYYAGRGVEQDYIKAADWYEKAAMQGVARAQDNLGLMYFHGRGRSEDMEAAVYWFRQAAIQGYVPAQYKLARHLEAGLGVLSSMEEALHWYKKAANQGDVAAKQGVARLEQRNEK